MSKYLSKVSDFHHSFGHPILARPQIPDEKRCNLRVSLLTEELKELQEAIEKKDIVAVADAFCDLQYVLSGAILEFGFASKFDALFTEVHRSNMSKACKSKEEAELTVKHYTEKENTECYISNGAEGEFLVYRKSDNKTLKSINYSPANLWGIVNE